MDELLKKTINHLRDHLPVGFGYLKRKDHAYFRFRRNNIIVHLRVNKNNTVIYSVYLISDNKTKMKYYEDRQEDVGDEIVQYYTIPEKWFEEINYSKVSMLYRSAKYYDKSLGLDFVDDIYDEVELCISKARELENARISRASKSADDSTRVKKQCEEEKTDTVELSREKVKKAKVFLESKMVGQDEYIKQVCCILMQMFTGEKVDTSLFIGKSGSGKTYAWELLCMDYESPLKDWLGYKIIDASMITPESYKGANITQVLSEVEEVKKQSKYFILIIDEFDKVLMKNPDDDNHKLQQNFLQILAHSRVQLDTRFGDSAEYVDFSDIPVVLLGAFQNYDFNYEEPTTKEIGFVKDSECEYDNNLTEQNIEDKLLAMGAMPELIGRISNYVILNELDCDVLKRKLKEITDEKAKNVEKQYNVKLEINDNIMNALTINENFGARSMNMCLNKIFNASLMYDVSVEGANCRVFLDENNNIIHQKIMQR